MTGVRGRKGEGERRSAEETALRLLATRSLTVHEIRSRLALRGHGPAEVERVVASLLSRGYLDDRLLAYNLASSLAARRLYGRARVAAELRRRGVPDDAIAEALDRAFAELDEDELALAAARRLAPGGRSPSGDKARQRIARSLLRRGLARGSVVRALRTVAGEEAAAQVEREGEDDEFEADT